MSHNKGKGNKRQTGRAKGDYARNTRLIRKAKLEKLKVVDND
jgi:hypothetical protein